MLSNGRIVNKCGTTKCSTTIMALDDFEIFNRVINTPEFLRLKRIKQLGVCPYGNHTRYDHSIGVYKEAERFLRILEVNSNMKINDFHKRCVKLAGLLHDIGHGPFSHFWEHVGEFKHEVNGLKLVSNIFSIIPLSEDNVLHDYGIRLIQSLIEPIDKNGGYKQEKFKWIADEDQFLFEIINNHICNIDVDRLDYLKRDWKNVRESIDINIRNNELKDVERLLGKVDNFFRGAKISEDREHILYNNEGQQIHAMFELRQIFHKYIYQTRRVKIIESLLQKMINIVKNDINTLDITKIDSSDKQFLNLHDDFVWEWIKKSNNAKVKYYLKACENYDTKINVFDEPTTNTEPISVEYKYEINANIKLCCQNWSDREYRFEDNFHFAIVE